MDFELIREWGETLLDGIGAKLLGVLLGALVSWMVFLRKKARALDRIATGESDDILFQAHYLQPLEGGGWQLMFRTLTPKLTVNDLYDNLAVRDQVRKLTAETSLKDPILPTTGRVGFEILNDAGNHIAGSLAVTAFPRRPWLFAMTCEDRKVTRKRCLRCFLIRPEDLERFQDWDWCRDHVRCEQPWHWFRIVALHQVALKWVEQQKEDAVGGFRTASGPLVDDQARHRRLRTLSLGIGPDEVPVASPVSIDWRTHAAALSKMGLRLEMSGRSEQGPAAGASEP